MISYPFRMVARALFALLLGLAATTASAGPLNPPAGPITSTYKTPDQVEPRIPVSSQTTPGTPPASTSSASPARTTSRATSPARSASTAS